MTNPRRSKEIEEINKILEQSQYPCAALHEKYKNIMKGLILTYTYEFVKFTDDNGNKIDIDMVEKFINDFVEIKCKDREEK